MRFLKRLVRRLQRNLNHFRAVFPKYARIDSAVRLHEYSLMGGIFLDRPSEVIESLRNTPTNQLLDNGEFYPLFYNSNPKTLDLLGRLVGELRPNTVVETGVANGASTRKILASFSELGLSQSKLFSLDVDPRVATPDLVSNPQFQFVLVDSSRSFVSSMHEIGAIDLFYHDSDHSYKNQMLEYSVAWEKLNPEKGVLISDDVNWSNAFLDFCKRVNRFPLLLSDGSTVSGVISK